MDIDIVNKISNLTFASFYNISINKVVVHFFNKDENKNDIIAYLNEDMAWDVREIVEEYSELDPSSIVGENITVIHNKLKIYEPGSNFDKFIRAAIDKMFDENNGSLIDDRVKEILKTNSYEAFTRNLN